jgi:opacity protein-like surface antigen
MTHDLRIALVIGVLMLLVVAPLDVSAEFYADLYTGAVFTKKTDLTIASSLGSTATYRNLQVNNSWTAGGRAGYWLEGLDWLGFGLDVFFFHVKAPNQMVPVTGLATSGTTLAPADWSLPVIGIGFDVLRLRAPLLRSEEFTHGRLQPYLSAGPALFVTWAETPWNIVQPKGQHDADVALGAKAEGGVTFLLTKTVGLFTEYRFTHFTSKLNYQNTTSAPASETYKANWDSHQVVGGVSFRF